MPGTNQFTKDDLKHFRARNVSLETIKDQLAIFEKGPAYLDIVRPCTQGDGIRLLEPGQVEHFVQIYEKALQTRTVAKFIPASGASTRMFQDLFTWRKNKLEGTALPLEEAAKKDDKNALFILKFLANLRRFAFYPLIQKMYAKLNRDVPTTNTSEDCLDIINTVLDDSGLGYGQFPKGLIKFHRYGDFMRTPFEEHLVEAAQYGRSAGHYCHMHYTVSKTHLDNFRVKFEALKEAYENFIGVEYYVDFTVQSSSTDTIAVTPENIPFRQEDGSILFRPGGHGALLGNLNAINHDIIYINNIDNVVPDRLKAERARWKKALAGFLVFLQERTFKFITMLSREDTNSALVKEAVEFASEFFGLQSYFHNLSPLETRAMAIKLLNRPVRICGMVKNQGDPGGAPFWTREMDGNLTVQIVESAQINKRSKQAVDIFSASTHFNPVDVVCGVKDYEGNKFDLEKFVDKEAVFISEKSMKGRSLRGLELPGLWNGSMSGWNSVFLEVSKAAFNPVKTVNDLLLPSHIV
ncbi:MAG: DUF4301 family protein [Desulfatibacillum sp.]|nr:DUF4301 family protein [Desulfatibacillum sp.]